MQCIQSSHAIRFISFIVLQLLIMCLIPHTLFSFPLSFPLLPRLVSGFSLLLPLFLLTGIVQGAYRGFTKE